MADGAVAYDTVRMPPFLAPAIAGAGPLAVGSSAAAIVPPLPVVFVLPLVPALLDGAAHAAISPIDAATPTARTMVARIFAPSHLQSPRLVAGNFLTVAGFATDVCWGRTRRGSLRRAGSARGQVRRWTGPGARET